MTDLENKIWDLVNEWCEMQYHETPEANKRYLMDMIHSLVKNCNKPHVIKSGCKCKNSSWNRDVGCMVCDDCGERI